MLAKRIIPTILTKNGALIKGVGFSADRVLGNALQSARIHAMRGVDELMILDVTATKEGREPDYEMVKRLSDGCFAPLTVGGGVKTEEHVRKLLRYGADKVCIGSAAINNPDCIDRLSDKFGSSTITVALDIKENRICLGGNSLDTLPTLDGVASQAQAAQERGAGEILLQSVELDGTMMGYDLELISRVAEAVAIPVIASGGCSGYNDMYEAIKAGASAVAAGALFQFTSATPKGAAEYLHEKGVEVRL